MPCRRGRPLAATLPALQVVLGPLLRRSRSVKLGTGLSVAARRGIDSVVPSRARSHNFNTWRRSLMGSRAAGGSVLAPGRAKRGPRARRLESEPS
jgi:hypothetical protein